MNNVAEVDPEFISSSPERGVAESFSVMAVIVNEVLPLPEFDDTLIHSGLETIDHDPLHVISILAVELAVETNDTEVGFNSSNSSSFPDWVICTFVDFEPHFISRSADLDEVDSFAVKAVTVITEFSVPEVEETLIQSGFEDMYHCPLQVIFIEPVELAEGSNVTEVGFTSRMSGLGSSFLHEEIHTLHDIIAVTITKSVFFILIMKQLPSGSQSWHWLELKSVRACTLLSVPHYEALELPIIVRTDNAEASRRFMYGNATA